MKKSLIVLLSTVALSAFAQEENITKEGLFEEVTIGYFKDSTEFIAFTREAYDNFARQNFNYADSVRFEHSLVETVYPDTSYYMVRSKAIIPKCNSLAVQLAKSKDEEGSIFFYLLLD